MGEVYLADDPHIDRKLAIKTVRLGDESAVEQEERKVRLMREAKAAGRVVHPNVVTLFDAGEAEGGVFFLAFEYVAGSDLAARQRQSQPLTLGEALRIVRQAAEGLDAAHRQGIVHRDIKPSNIMLDERGQVKISDFGIAKMLGQATELTQTGSVVGSPHYLSPEQIRGEELDGRSDLFSLGVVFYELLTRTRPFEGDTITTLVYQILAREPLPLDGMHPGLPPRLGGVVTRMLAKDREQRYPTARELADDLLACERELPKELLDAPAAPQAGADDETARLPRTPTPTPGPTLGGAPTLLKPPPSPPTPTPPTAVATPPPPPAAAAADIATGATRMDTPLRRTVVAPSAEAAAAASPPPLPGSNAPIFPPPPSSPSSGGTGAPAFPPAPPAQVAAPAYAAPAAPAAPAYAAPAAAPARKSGFPWVIVIVLLVLGFLAVAGALLGWWWYRRGQTQTAEVTPIGTPAEQTIAADTPPAAVATTEPAATTVEPAPVESPAAAPVEQPTTVPVATTELRPAAPSSPVAPPLRIEKTTRHESAPPPKSETRNVEPEAEPPAREASHSHAAPPAYPPPSAPAPPHDEEPAAPSQAYDRELQTSTALKFDVQPETTVVSLKQEGERRFTVIGRAADYPADKKKMPAFDLPGPGIYYLRLYNEGREVVFRLDARGSGAPTTIQYKGGR